MKNGQNRRSDVKVGRSEETFDVLVRRGDQLSQLAEGLSQF